MDRWRQSLSIKVQRELNHKKLYGTVKLTFGIFSSPDLLKDETIFIQNASVAVNITDKEIILGLQSCLTRIVFSRRFKVSEGSLNSQVDSTASLIPKLES